MAKILNPSMPTGTRGLWWFAQSLANLGTAATGDAVLDGDSGNLSTLSGGEVIHDNALDKTQLAADTSQLIPTTAVTVAFQHRFSDTTLRDGSGFGHVGSDIGGGQFRAGAYFVLSDGKIYWDFGGADEGGHRRSVSVTKDTNSHVWVFTTGSRGMEIWRDGVTIATNAAAPTRSANTDRYDLGRHFGANSDLGKWHWVMIHETQLEATLIQAISSTATDTLTLEVADAAGGAVLTWSANTMIGGGIVA